MKRCHRRTFLATTSGIALATAVGLLASSPARALPPECSTVGFSITCTGLVSGSVEVPENWNLVNNGTIPGVYTNSDTSTTNNGTVAVSDTVPFVLASTDGTGSYVEIHESHTAFDLGYRSVLDNFGTVSSTVGISANISEIYSETGFDIDMTAKAVGVLHDDDAFINNSSTIAAVATNALTLSNFDEESGSTKIIGYAAAYGVLSDEGLLNITNNAAGIISATATYTINLSDVDGDRKFKGLSAFAVGIATTNSYTEEDYFFGSVIDNKGTINATATMNFTVGGPEGSHFTFYGSKGDFNAPTVAAFGIMAEFGATVTNSGTINSTATANFSVTNTDESYIGEYYNGSYRAPPEATAVGIYVGAEIKPAPWYTPYHYFGDGYSSVDTITNSGPINATATFNLTATNNSYLSADVGSTATGILMQYPTYVSCCEDSDWEGWVSGTAMITNSGPIVATAATNMTVNVTGSEAFGEYFGINIFEINSSATGIDIDNIGGGEGGVKATIINSGPVTATATSTFTFTGNNVFGDNYIVVDAYATGIEAEGFNLYNCCGPDFNFGPSITNSGVLNVTAIAQATINYSTTLAFGGGEIGNAIGVFSGATGIDAYWEGAQVVNSGAINVLAKSLLTVNVTSTEGNFAAVNFISNCCYPGPSHLNVDSEAYGITAGNHSTITNSAPIDVTALSQLTINANAPNVDSYAEYVYINADATGIGGAEGYHQTIDNTGAIKAIAQSTFNATGNVYAQYIYMYADAYGIDTDGDASITNTASIQASAIVSLTYDAGLGEGAMFGAYANELEMYSNATGIQTYSDSFIWNKDTGSILATAATNFTALGLTEPEGGYGYDLYANAKGIAGAEGNLVRNDGTISAIASITVNTPNYEFYGYMSARAYGMDFGSDNNITNKGSIAAIASVSVSGLYEEGEPTVKAYGIKVDNNNSIINDGTITVLAGFTVNGITQDQFATGWDPAKSYGIKAGYDNYITNNGTIENIRIGPNHWAVYLKDYYDCCYGPSHFTNTGTTIGSIYLGSDNGIAVNTGTMAFRVQPPPAGNLGIASYGTYDRIVMRSNTSLDTTNGIIQIRPLGNPTAYANATIYPYFVTGNNGDGVAPIVGNGSTLTGLAPGQPPQLTTTSAFFIPSLQTTPTDATWYDSTDGMDLIMTRVAFSNPLGNPELPGNQGTVGEGLEKAFQELVDGNSDPNGPFGALLGKIQELGPDQVAGAYQQLAGEITSNMANIGQNTASQMMGALFGSIGQFATGQGPGADKPGQNYANKSVQYASLDVAQATPGQPKSATTTPGTGRWMAWLGGYGQTGSVDSQPGISGVDYSVAGAMIGLEYALTGAFRVGVALGGGASWANLDNVNGEAESKFFQVALYASYTLGNWYVDGALGYGRHWVETDRTVGIPGFNDALKGDFDANQFITGFETGYRFQFGQFQVVPFAGMQISVFSQDAFTETGGPAALHFNSETTTSVRGILGAYVRTTFQVSEKVSISPYARLAWAHEFGDQAATVTANFAAAPTSSFSVYGAERSRDALILGLGFEMNIGKMYNVYASYLGDITSRGSTHAGTGGVRIRW